MFSLQSSLLLSSHHVLEAILINLKGCVDYFILFSLLGGTTDFLLELQPWLAITYCTPDIRAGHWYRENNWMLQLEMSKAVWFCLFYPTEKCREDITKWKGRQKLEVLVPLYFGMSTLGHILSCCLEIFELISCLSRCVYAETDVCVLYCRGRFIPLGVMQLV